MKDQEKNIPVKRYDKYIVCVGASAGGLEAIHEFFDHMPHSASFSFIVIQHLSSDYKSLLVELVAKHTHMKVFEAEHDMAIQQDCVYIIPNNKLMTISRGRLKLADKSLIKAPNTAIDTFLHTLAKDKKDKAIAVILSGTGTDGTKGIESIKAQNGLVIVQDPSTAKFDGMPNSAIESGNIDFILPPNEIYRELLNFVNEEPVKLLENGKIDEKLLDEIFTLVQEQSGNNFNLYKTPTIIRRISRRMNEHGIKVLKEYVGYLRDHSAEVKILGQDFLIGVTSFFRDPQAFELLESKILPEIIDQKSEDDIFKIWVCACSTGQEAYSLAILVDHCLKQSGKRLDVKIFATDIDEKSVEIAARNQYPLSIQNEIPPQFLKKYFTTDGNFYSIIPELRKQVVFAKHDVIKSPPFIKNDLVTCRNMLIYMNGVLQQKILSTFHFSLNQSGFLFLGSSESAMSIKDGVTEISNKWKFYQKTGPISYSTFNTYKTGGRLVSTREQFKGNGSNVAVSAVETRFNKFITQELGYAGVFIDKNCIIQEAVGNFKQFLTLPDQKIELNLLKMVPREVAVVLNNALRKVWKDHKKVQINKTKFILNGNSVWVNITIQPPNEDSSLTMLVFGESQLEVVPEKEDMVILSSLSDDQQSQYVYELEAELSETRNNLQLVVEEMETTNEELQSTNEELLSANEELQSGNEELQSLNEELHTLNTEHQLKIKELTELNDDLDNYFKSTDIGQVFLDSKLFIRKFNPAAVHLVNLIEADIGRSIEQISTNIQTDDMASDIRSVLLSGRVVEKEVQLKNGKRSLMRIMPYVRKDRKTDGAVITFVDISKITELNNIITGVYNASLNAILAFTAVRNHEHMVIDFKCISHNEAALKLLGRTKEDLYNSLMVKQLPELLEGNLYNKLISLLEKGQPLETELPIKGDRWIKLVAVKMADGFAATLTDITQQKLAEQKLKRNYNELVGVRENLKQLNAELELKVEERTRELSESEERFNQVSRATNDTIWDWNFVDNTMWRSDNFTSMFGYAKDQVNNNTEFWFEKIHPDDRKRVRDSVFKAINEAEKQWSAQYRLQKQNGQYSTILDRGTIMQDDFQTPYRMVGSMVDVSRLIETEAKLSSSEKKFKDVFDSNLIAMMFFSIHSGRIEDANEAFLTMLGYTAEDVANGITLKDITPESDLSLSKTAVEEVRQKRVCSPFEMQYLRKDGQTISVMIGSGMLEEGNDDNAVAYVININDQKEAEQKRNELQRLIKKQQDEFYSIFKNAPALITIRRSNSLAYEFVNNAFNEFYGDRGYIGKTSAEVSPDFSNATIRGYEQEVLRTGDTFIARAFPLERKDPLTGDLKEYWFDFIFTPVFNDEGQIDGIAFFGFEVTDLVKAQQATKDLMHKKDEFMSIASHELKTPITSIKGFLQLALRMSEKTADQHLITFIGKANRQLANLTSLVEDLLDVTKIQAGKMQFNYGRFNMKALINECVEDIQNTENFQISVTHLDDVDVNGDQHRIEQVINNFLSNAIKYSPDVRKAEVYTEVIGDNIKVTVRDFGVGIAADKLELVFDRFIRVHDSSYNFSGLGLGLYISSEIVRRHEGTIGVESVVNEGSSFWFKIPIAK